MDAKYEDARPGDEPGQAQESKAMGAGFESNHAHDRQVRTPLFAPYLQAGLTLIPLHRWDAVDAKGNPRGKSPLHGAWSKREYASSEAVSLAAKNNSNVGVRLPASVVVLDVDPRNFGEGDSLLSLMIDTGLDLRSVPKTATGGGGAHYWFSKPVDVTLLDSLEAYPGVEFKSLGRQVVAAGSVHPNGLHYLWEGVCDLSNLPPLPPSVLRLARREVISTGQAAGFAELTPELLAETLEQLDPADFRDHDEWLQLMMACHHATAGEGRQEFVDWSTSDPEFEDHGWIVGRRWDSLHAESGRGGRPITVRYLHKVVQDAGGEVARTPPEDDFEAVAVHDLPRPSKWRFLSVEDLESMPPPKWLVPGILVEGSIAALYGQPESGKSFLAVDMAMSVAGGVPWHGRPVERGAVLYIAAEGAPGLGKRVRAWKIEKDLSNEPVSFSLMRDPLNMSTDAEAKEFARTVSAELGPLRMVVIDTLNQTAAGADENSAQDMGRYISAMKQLRDVTGAAVVVVHHSGKDLSRGMRGSTALLGAMDTTVEVERATDGHSIKVCVAKQKDAEREPPIRFNLAKVADSLVLRATMIAEAAADFASNGVSVLARELAISSGGRVAMKDLVAAVMERDTVSEATARRSIRKAVPEGRKEGVSLWMERADNNRNGELVIFAE